ncbi:unnamed protein product, partial [Sphacelaria rigidula]
MNETTILLEELGRGGGGTVHKALHVPSMRLVAVKIMQVHDDEKRNQLIRELKTLNSMARVSIRWCGRCPRAGCRSGHLPIVAFHDAYTETETGSVCMVMEYMDGGTLQEFVSRGEALSERALAAVGRSVLRGLADMHSKHQIHRDIKPSNILLDKHGRVKLSDFGVVRELTSTGSLAKTFTGTLTYMSPERITHKDYSYPSDIWSLGLVIVALALGKFPLPTHGGVFEMMQAIANDPVPTLPRQSFTPELCEFVDFMLQREPADRPTACALLQHPFLTKHYRCRKVAEL